MVKWRQIEQNFVLRGIRKSWAGFRLVQIRANTALTPKIEALATSLLGYDQTVADAATLWIDKREVIAVANAPKFSLDSR